jgi:triacylglycerol lipase
MNIVLVHGILGFRQKFKIEYFNGVKEHLASFTPTILVPELNPTGSILTGGEELRAKLWEAFGNGTLDPSQRTHIIAHSQGGLDARFMLSPANPNSVSANDHSPKIASLTTIGSPHQGSPIADLLLLRPLDQRLARLEAFIHHPLLGEALVRAGLDLLGLDGNALDDLSTEKMAQFNQDFPDHPTVRYYSVAGAGRSRVPQTSRLLFGFYLYIKSLRGEPNDGLVTVSSAQRWNADSQIWPTDHADEIGHDLDSLDPHTTPSFDYLGGYENIVNRVRSL